MARVARKPGGGATRGPPRPPRPLVAGATRESTAGIARGARRGDRPDARQSGPGVPVHASPRGGRGRSASPRTSFSRRRTRDFDCRTAAGVTPSSAAMADGDGPPRLPARTLATSGPRTRPGPAGSRPGRAPRRVAPPHPRRARGSGRGRAATSDRSRSPPGPGRRASGSGRGPCATRDPPEPVPERVPFAVAAESLQAAGDGLEDLLNDVLHVLGRDAPAAAPVPQQGV